MGVTLSTASPLPDDVSLQSFNGSWRIKNKVLLETVTFAGNATKTSGNLDQTYDFYVVEGNLKHSVGSNLRMQVNGIGSGYSYNGISSNSVLYGASQASCWITNLSAGDNTLIYISMCRLSGITGVLGFNMNCGSTADTNCYNGFCDTAANTSIANITFLTATGSLTGTLKIYGVSIGGL